MTNETDVVMPFNSDEFRNIWRLWKIFRAQEFKKKYKSTIGEQAALTHLCNLGEGRQDMCIEIIKQSMGNSWQGFFPLKNNYQNDNKTNGNSQGIGDSFDKFYQER